MQIKYTGPQSVFGCYGTDGKTYQDFPQGKPASFDSRLFGYLLSRSDFVAVEHDEYAEAEAKRAADAARAATLKTEEEKRAADEKRRADAARELKEKADRDAAEAAKKAANK